MMPFAGGIENTANGALVLSVLAGILYLAALGHEISWRRSVMKTLPVVLLAVVAFYQNGPLLLVVGLLLSAAGDYLLSRDGDAHFLAGLASFLAAHIAYIVLFFGHGEGAGVLLEPWRALTGIASLAFSLGMLNVLLRRVKSSMRLPIIAYTAAIQLMGWAALSTGNMVVIAGALMFMSSDTILAWEKFVEVGFSSRRKPMRVAVWVLYYAAQLLITLGFVLS